jgi:menaquinone-dependent protoporphyrinogen IX oxidase
MKILVTYAGTTGPAAEAAERVVRVMTGLGADMTLRPMSGVTSCKRFFGCCGRLSGAGGRMGS